MTNVLAHRGPDSHGMELFEAEQVGLGHRRLSILDLSERGRQPMSDPGGELWITFNGEIYNYRELRTSLEREGFRFRSDTDTEVILHAYRCWGPECLERFNGMFAFALWDRRIRTLFAARDRLGIKPLYYAQHRGVFSFASEIKALFESGLVERAVDYEALHTPALYQATPRTGFRDIFKLPPASSLTLHEGRLRIDRYWSIAPKEQEVPLAEAVSTLDGLLQSAIELQMISDVPVGAFLSGGLDSSLIVALMARRSNQPVNTFTIRYGDEDQKFEQMPDDSAYARIVAQLFGCRHREFTIAPDIADLLPKMIWHLDEPLADPATINTYLISAASRKDGIVVLLNGMGGDEVFGGYRSQLAALLAETYRAYVPELARAWVHRAVEALPSATRARGIRSVRWAKRFLSMASASPEERYLTGGMTDDYSRMFTWEHTVKRSILEHHHSVEMLRRLQRTDLSYLTRMCLADTEVYLPDHNLTYSDRCTMAAGVEGRPPLTDHRIVEFMFSLAPSFRIRKRIQKWLLKVVAEQYLPKKIVYRPKAPFGAPLRAWIRGGLKPMVDDLLNPAALKRRGIYSVDYVTGAIQRDRDGQEDNAHFIWRLLCNELWFRTYFP